MKITLLCAALLGAAEAHKDFMDSVPDDFDDELLLRREKLDLG